MRRKADTSATSGPLPLRSFKPWLILVSIGLGIATITMDNSMVAVSLPALADAFSVEADVILWLTVAGSLVSVGLVMTWGSLGDSLGRRRIYLVGFIFFTLGLLVLSLSQDMVQLITGRIVQAIGLSMIVTNGYAIAIAAFPERNRGKVIGALGSFVGFGLALGPVTAGVILDLLDWRGLFYTRLPLGLLVMGFATLVIPKDQPAGERQPFDYLGAVALFVTLVSLLLAINRAPRLGLDSPFIMGLIATTLIAGGVFIVAELQASMPVVNFSLLRSRFLSVSIAVHFLYFNAYVFLILLIPFYLLHARGLTATQMGLFIAMLQVTRLFISPVAGWLTDRLGSGTVATAGIASAALGIALLARLDPASSMFEIAFGLILAGTGSAVFDPSNESGILRAVPEERLASATAMTTTARQTGFSIGTGIAGTLYAARLRLHESAILDTTSATLPMQEAVALAYREVVLVAVVLILLTVGLSLLRGRDRRVQMQTVPIPHV